MCRKYIEPNLDIQIDPDDLWLQWRTYNEVLGKIIKDKKDLTSLGCLKVLVDPKKGVYKGIEGVLSILVRATVANA